MTCWECSGQGHLANVCPSSNSPMSDSNMPQKKPYRNYRHQHSESVQPSSHAHLMVADNSGATTAVRVNLTTCQYITSQVQDVRDDEDLSIIGESLTGILGCNKMLVALVPNSSTESSDQAMV